MGVLGRPRESHRNALRMTSSGGGVAACGGRSWSGRLPVFEDRLERFLFRPIDSLAAFPRDGLDQFFDFALDAVPQVVRVHRVKLPTLFSVVGDKPAVTRVFPFVGCPE